MAHAPPLHFQAAWLVEIDRFRPNQGRSVIVDYIFFFCIDNSEPRPEWKARPIGRGAHHLASGQIGPDGIMTTTSLGMRISGRANLPHLMPRGDGRFRLRRTANDEASDSSCGYKVKALRHLQYSHSIAMGGVASQ